MLRAMPTEGHYARQTALYKLSPREIKAAWIAGVVTFAAMIAIVLVTVSDSNPPTPIGCIRAEVAGIVGGETISGCGAEAELKCSHAANFDSPRARTVVAECEKQGIKF